MMMIIEYLILIDYQIVTMKLIKMMMMMIMEFKTNVLLSAAAFCIPPSVPGYWWPKSLYPAYTPSIPHLYFGYSILHQSTYTSSILHLYFTYIPPISHLNHTYTTPILHIYTYLYTIPHPGYWWPLQITDVSIPQPQTPDPPTQHFITSGLRWQSTGGRRPLHNRLLIGRQQGSKRGQIYCSMLSSLRLTTLVIIWRGSNLFWFSIEER